MVIPPIAQARRLIRGSDTRIAGLSNDHYTSTLDMLKASSDEAYKNYLSQNLKAQGWFRRWGRAVAGANFPASASGSTPPPRPTTGGESSGPVTPARAPALPMSDD